MEGKITKTIGAFDAKAKLSELLQQVAIGEEFIITRRGIPVARLSRYALPAEENTAENALKRLADRARMGSFAPFDWAEWKDSDLTP